MKRSLTTPPGSTIMHYLRGNFLTATHTACGRRANLANWSTGPTGVTCRDCLAIADQSPKGRDPQGLDAQHASGGAVRQSPVTTCIPSEES